jgi:hypothetical protein
MVLERNLIQLAQLNRLNLRPAGPRRAVSFELSEVFVGQHVKGPPQQHSQAMLQ